MTAVAAPTVTTVPQQRRDPEAPWPGQLKEATRLMRRLWACDPDAADELVAGLAGLNRTQLGRIIDNLMWTISNQPRPMNAAQWQRIQLLWGRKMRKPMDNKALRKFANMPEDEADRFIRRFQMQPDLMAAA